VAALTDSVELDGGRVASYEVIGDGAPLFYFPGGPGFSAALLRPDAELLADSFSVHLVDPAGSGGSTPPAEPSQYDHVGHARFYDEVRRALGVERAMIMGHSFGGVVALTYASLYPQHASGCISVASRVVGEQVEGQDAAAEMEASLSRHESQPWYPSARAVWDEWTDRVLAAQDPREVDSMMAEVLPLYTANPDSPGVKAMIEEWRADMRSDLAALKVWESGLWQGIDARPLLAQVTCSTLLLVGALDLICGPAQARLIAEALAGAEVVVVPDCGHFIAAEAPDAFRAAIVGFAG